MTRLCRHSRSGLPALVLLATGCGASQEPRDGERLTNPTGQPVAVEAGAQVDEQNPFAANAHSFEASSPREQLDNCVKVRLDVSAFVPPGELRATFHVSNQCSQSVAVLTAPIEQQVVTDGGAPPPALMGSAVYALLKLAPRARPFDEHLGDGGKAVSVLPLYTTLSPGASKDIPLVGLVPGASQLPPGEYLLSLLTPVTWAGQVAEFSHSFDLSQSVVVYNARVNAERAASALRLPGAAVRLGAGCVVRLPGENSGGPAGGG